MKNLTAQELDDLDSAITDSLTLIGADDVIQDKDTLDYITRLRILQRRIRGEYVAVSRKTDGAVRA